MRGRWVVACAAGEAAGMAMVATAYAASDRGLIGPALPWILAAGAVEGLCLGAAQAGLLRGRGVRPGRWIGLTVVAAVLGYALSAAGGAGSGPEGAAEPARWLLAAMGAGFGLATGALMGVAQALALGADRGRWVLANALGWAPGMAVIVLAASTVGRATPLAGVAAAGAGAGAVAGVSVGIATGLVLARRSAE